MPFDSPLPPYNSSDPTATFLNSSCLDLLMIELVPMAYRVVNEVDAASLDDRIAPSAKDSKAGNESSVKSTGTTAAGAGSVAGGTSTAGGRKMEEDEERDAVFYRLEMLGYRVGQGLVERYARVPDSLTAISWPRVLSGFGDREKSEQRRRDDRPGREKTSADQKIPMADSPETDPASPTPWT